jgi:hypothetical protein
VQAQSQDRVSKEREMRRRRLRKLWNRLCELQKMKLNLKALLIKIGEAKKEAGRAFGLIDLKLPNPGKNLKGDLWIRPIFHQLPHRIKAHIFIAFVTYCLHVTLRRSILGAGCLPWST